MANQPKKYKKFVATAATATLVASAIVPVASAATPSFPDIAGNDHAKAIEAIAALGYISGKADGTFAPNDQVTRSQVVYMLGRWAEDAGLKVPADYKTVQRFKDVPLTADETFLKYTALLKDNGIFEGSNGNLNGSGKFQRQHMAVVLDSANKAITGTSLVELAGDTSDVTVGDLDKVLSSYRTQVLALKKLGVTAPANFNPSGIVNRGQFASFLYKTINVEAPATEAAVKSVKAINATQVEVEFTKAVDETDLRTNIASVFTIDGNDAASVLLSKDGKTATFTFALAAEVEVSDAVVVVNPVKLATDSNVKTAKYTGLFTFEDVVNPEILSVESVTAGSTATSVTVTASEPIASATAKVDGVTRVINFGGTNVGTITGLSLDASTSHSIELLAVTDKGGNVTPYTSKTFSVTVDKVAPTATLSAQSDKQILVTFSKSMNVASVVAAFGANVGVKDETLANVNHSAVVTAVPGTDNKQFLIPVTDTLYTNTTSRTLTVILPATLEDNLGNKIASATTQSVTLTKDTTKPVVTGYKVIKNASGNVTDIEVQFSEALAGNLNPAEPVIVDENGVLVTATLLGGLTADAVVSGDKKITYSVGTPGKVYGKFAFSFGAGLVTDQAETANTSDAFNQTIDFGTAPAAGAWNLTSAATGTSNVITVEFGRAVKGGGVANSATDLANYTLGGKALPTGTTITLDAAQDTATITLPDQSVATTDGNAVFTVSNVKDLNGTLITPFYGSVDVDDNVDATLKSAVLNNDGTITIGFDEALATDPAAGDFVLTLNGYTVASSEYTVVDGVGSDAGKYVVTAVLTFDDLGDVDATNDVLFIDLNGDGDFDAGEIVFVTGAANGALVGNNGDAANLKSNLINSAKIATKASGATTGVDAAGNTLKLNVSITVK